MVYTDLYAAVAFPVEGDTDMPLGKLAFDVQPPDISARKNSMYANLLHLH